MFQGNRLVADLCCLTGQNGQSNHRSTTAYTANPVSTLFIFIAPGLKRCLFCHCRELFTPLVRFKEIARVSSDGRHGYRIHKATWLELKARKGAILLLAQVDPLQA